MTTNARLSRFRSAAEHELRGDILPYWATNAVDREQGGFLGAVSIDGQPDPKAGKGGVLNARILWTFAAALRRYPDPQYRELADREFDYLLAHFWDKEFGGLYWEVDHLGRPANPRKQTYGQAFGIYGLAEYFRATEVREALDRAIGLFEDIEAHTFDPKTGGYWEARGRDWQPIPDIRLSDQDMNVPFSMNTHLHILEAYATLAQVWDDPRPRTQLRLLLELFLDRIVDATTAHQILFFDEQWRSQSDQVSYGHDIETSWLLCEAADVLGDATVRRRAEQLAVRMADAVLAEGFDRELGGVYNDRANGHLNTDKDWWPLAEGVVGFLNAYRLSGRPEHLDAALQTWSFIDRYAIDHERGEWYTRVSRHGVPNPTMTKVDFWKCPYHNTRAMLEIIERTHQLEAAAL
jgi:mannobiose 2-epimerase